MLLIFVRVLILLKDKGGCKKRWKKLRIHQGNWQKRQRNLRISNNWLREEPDNPWANFWYNYIRMYQ